MLKPAEKTAPTLIHHPTAVLDDLCTFDLANEAWVLFDEQITAQIRDLEEANRAHFTPRAVRESLGRK
jgi:hypothetical protein